MLRGAEFYNVLHEPDHARARSDLGTDSELSSIHSGPGTWDWRRQQWQVSFHILLQPFNGLFSRTTWVSRYQKGKTNLDFAKARDSEWQWHQLGHVQVCTSLQTDNHASTAPLIFTGRMPFLPRN